MFKDNIFVAAADSSTLWWSTDGKTWNYPDMPSGSANFSAIAYDDNGHFVVVANDYGTSYYSSGAPDPTNKTKWEWKVGSGIDNKAQLNDVTYGDKFVAVGLNNSMPAVYSSVTEETTPIGQKWTAATGLSGSNALKAVVFAPDQPTYKYVAVGNGGTIWHSPDGKQWTQDTISDTCNFQDVTYAAGTFVAVADNGAIWVATTGNSGPEWDKAVINSSSNPIALYSVAASDTVKGSDSAFVAVGGSDYPEVWYSPNGATRWSPGQFCLQDEKTRALTCNSYGYYCGDCRAMSAVEYDNGWFTVVPDEYLDAGENYPSMHSNNGGVKWTQID
jgi:hypothetical protein